MSVLSSSVHLCKGFVLVQDVCNQIWATLYDYPSLKACDGLIRYIKECVRTAWGLVNQVLTAK